MSLGTFRETVCHIPPCQCTLETIIILINFCPRCSTRIDLNHFLYSVNAVLSVSYKLNDIFGVSGTLLRTELNLPWHLLPRALEYTKSNFNAAPLMMLC